MTIRCLFMSSAGFLAFFISLVPLCAQTSATVSSTAVRSVLDAQVGAWNRGDIDGFMAGYANSPSTTFVSGDTVTHGWQTVRDRYKKGYDSREKMGTLSFDDLEVNIIDENTAVVDGHWKLTRSGDTPHGRFSLIFHRSKDGWQIVHDHTTSLP